MLPINDEIAEIFSFEQDEALYLLSTPSGSKIIGKKQACELDERAPVCEILQDFTCPKHIAIQIIPELESFSVEACSHFLSKKRFEVFHLSKGEIVVKSDATKKDVSDYFRSLFNRFQQSKEKKWQSKILEFAALIEKRFPDCDETVQQFKKYATKTEIDYASDVPFRRYVDTYVSPPRRVKSTSHFPLDDFFVKSSPSALLKLLFGNCKKSYLQAVNAPPQGTIKDERHVSDLRYELLGCHEELCEKIDALEHAIVSAINPEEPTLVDVIFEQKEPSLQDAMLWLIQQKTKAVSLKENELRLEIRTYMKLQLIKLLLHDILACIDRGQIQDAAVLLTRSIPQVSDNEQIQDIALYFQVQQKKIFWPKQIRLIKQALQEKRYFFQIGCGEGKTQVITAFLALVYSLTEIPPIVVVPRNNFEENYRDLKEQFHELSRQNIHIFSFDRFSEAQAGAIEDAFRTACQIKDLFLSDPETLQSLELTYFDLVLRSDRNFAPVERMLEHIMTSCPVVMDELHYVLRPNHKLTYALGREKSALPAYRWKVPAMLFEGIVKLGTSDMRALAEYAADAIVSDEKEKCIAYFLHKQEVESTELEVWLAAKEKGLQDELILIRAHLHVYLPNTLSGRQHVDYGLFESIEQAIPYEGHLQPAPHSNFELYDALVNFTFSAYLKSGLKKQQVKQYIQKLQQDQALEKRLNPEKTAASEEEFTKLVDLPLSSINLQDNEVLDTLYDALHKNPACIFSYLQQFVLPNLHVTKEKTNSTAHDIAAILCRNLIAMSATPVNYFTYPLDLPLSFDETANGEALALLLDPNVTQIAPLSKTAPHDVLQQFSTCSCVLDPDALNVGIENESVIKNLLHGAQDGITHGLFFDKKNTLKLLDRKGRIVDFSSAVCSEESRLTYYDEQHTIGVHIKQKSDAVGLLLVNKQLMLTKLIQAAKRLRGLGKGQKIILAVPEDLYKAIMDRFGACSHEALLFWALTNEADSLIPLLLPSHLDLLHSLYRRQALVKILSEKDLTEKNGLVQHYSKLLKDVADFEEFRLHGSLKPGPTAVQIFNEKKKEYATRYADLHTDEIAVCEDAALSRLTTVLDPSYSQQSQKAMTLVAQEQMVVHFTQQSVQAAEETKSFTFKKWDPLKALADPAFISTFVEQSGKHLAKYGYYYGKTVLFEPLGRLFPKVGFSIDFFATENFFKINSTLRADLEGKSKHSTATNMQLVTPQSMQQLMRTKVEPKFVFWLQANKVDKFVLITDDEASAIRKTWFLTATTTKPLCAYALFDRKGARVTGNSDTLHPDALERIMAQIDFLSLQIHYTGKRMSALQSWIDEGEKSAKKTFFEEALTLRGHVTPDDPLYHQSVLRSLIA